MKNILATLLFFTYVTFTFSEPMVSIGTTQIVGTFMETIGNRIVSAFRGIPYAEAPIGHLRFRNPLPIKSLNGTFMATNNSPKCVQYYFKDYLDEGNEDCLYLNIYTPQITDSERRNLLPVMVYIHGGAYTYFSSNSRRFGPDYILDRDVVLVTMNYRLGIFGFLSTGDAEAPGNFGLKDQVLALRWVQENILYFGGNPDKVTLFGLSAGSNCVDLHTLSDSSNGLFHQYIMESGNAISPRSFQERKEYSKYAWALGELFNCPLSNSTVLIDCLRNLETYSLNLNNLTCIFNDIRVFVQFTWCPTDEPDIDGAFITDTPFNLIKKNKRKDIPAIRGMVKDEGLLFVDELYVNEKLYNRISQNLDKFLMELFNTFPLVKDIPKTIADIKQFYFDPHMMTDKNWTLHQLSSFMGDIFRYSYEKMMMCWNSRNAKKPIYMYSFDYRGTISFSTAQIRSNRNIGTDHGDETLYLFPIANLIYNISHLKMGPNDFKMINTMVDLWTSFATNGAPVTNQSSIPDIWKTYTPGNNILQIGNNSNPNLSIINSLYEDRINFWLPRLYNGDWCRDKKEILLKKTKTCILCQFEQILQIYINL